MKYLVYLLALCLVSNVALAGIGPSGAPVGCFSDSIIDVTAKGAKVDEQECSTGNTTGCTHGVGMLSGSAIVTDATDNPWTSNDCHSGAGCTGPVDKLATVDAAVSTTSEAFGTIVGFTNSGQITVSFTNTSGGNITAKDMYWGSPDDAAWTAAFAQCVTQGGCTIIQPSGCSDVSTAFIIPTTTHVTIAGMGSRSYTGAPANKLGTCIRWITRSLAGPAMDFAGAQNVTYTSNGDKIEDISLFGGDTLHADGGGHDGVRVLNWGSLTFNNVNIVGFTNNGINLDALSGSSGTNYVNNVTVRDSVIDNNGANGVSISDAAGGYVQGVNLESNQIVSNYGAGVKIPAGGLLYGMHVAGNLIQFNNFGAANPGAEFWNAGTIHGGAMIGNHFETSTSVVTNSMIDATHDNLFICGNYSIVFAGGGLPLTGSGQPQVGGACQTN